MKKILITGANSYVGTSFEKWLSQWPDEYHVDTIDMIDGTWREKSFVGYDAVFHVAGIAHVSADPSKKDLYYRINRDLAIDTAKKAKNDGVKQFIFMSSMIIYGADEPVGKEKIITRDTQPNPADFYGDSKLQADLAIQKMADDKFIVSIMRPPVIYGHGCKGNFPKLLKLAKYALIFPNIENRRSMIYIDNFTECVRLVINNTSGGIFFPQNEEYVSTKDIVINYRKIEGKMIFLIPFPDIMCKVISRNKLFKKAFGSKIYLKELSNDNKFSVVDFNEGLMRIAIHA
ncbi:NAD-dependent epimerase/dehydratase family protein [Cloacibacillus evryensis]|uniref:NAD-dependent epimerase/dehydratase family protein n=1 Tax=Cloacibacillus evryensis TaxID=508460 RepID=A0AAW5K1G8_9BACT|nr:NAD-dependent epimerase/dehydratase family protein [Cloacibacillus evryensis]MCQ4814665.1 NAD-dependent epimerase/dehydratase family protein [Cloacibacillus evryensis]